MLERIALREKGVRTTIYIPNRLLKRLSEGAQRLQVSYALTPQVLDYLALNSVLDLRQAKAELEYEGRWKPADFLS